MCHRRRRTRAAPAHSRNPGNRMNPAAPPPPAHDLVPPAPIPPLPEPTEGTPWTWRLAIAVGVVVLTWLVFQAEGVLGPRGQSAVGIVAFFGVAAFFSTNLRNINWRTVGWGIVLQ